ncbi:hypothetical protein [Alterisphingorhabdus coralli]|uniref:Terminase small subunit n=1 Tax=Alterisphingorhabdus coralli TaxID=3071408 RepID=A0AA97I2J2_9SPHN|nr:hypothetical protein [Parasphingorhabdus sp. SCSIO 66989]WOE76308.1 hypothetical protein RB602_06245 [Parasphingorhabdus sp. SCSIO 66989]
MMSGIDDLLGTKPQEESVRERRLNKLAKDRAIKAAGSGTTFVEMGALKRPVSMNFLSEVFNMDPKTVRTRLVRCPILGMAGGNRPVYDFKTACQYLLPPKMTTDEFIRTLNAAKLPPEVNKVFWQAQRERLRYLRDAGEVWHTTDLLDLLGQVNMTFKDRIDMWVEDIREMKGISDENILKIEQMTHALKSDLYEALVSMPSQGETLSLRDKEDPLAPEQSKNTEIDEGQISDAL